VTAKGNVQLTLSQGKKEDEVDDVDDYVVRTSVSQDRVIATLYRGIVPLHSVYILFCDWGR
jgi:hypothetical protein